MSFKDVDLEAGVGEADPVVGGAELVGLHLGLADPLARKPAEQAPLGFCLGLPGRLRSRSAAACSG
jgi:hypothetical protein